MTVGVRLGVIEEDAAGIDTGEGEGVKVGTGV